MKRVLLVCALIAGFFVGSGGSPVAAASPFTGFSVESYGSFVSALKGTAKSGPTALSVLGCTSQTGLETAHSTAELNLDGIGNVGAVVTSGRTFEIAGGIADRATSAVADVRLFNGLIQVEAMTAEATAMRLGTSLATEAHTSIGSVTIGSNQLDVSTEPNTTIDLTLPGAGSPFGYVVLNSQQKKQGSNGITMTARAVDVHITGNNPFGLPLDSRIVIGLARASIKPEMQDG